LQTLLRPPSPTLFPYTTLFRSRHRARYGGGVGPGNRNAAQFSIGFERRQLGRRTGAIEEDDPLLLGDIGQDEAIAAQSGLVLLRSEEHTSELQSPYDLVCRLLL